MSYIEQMVDKISMNYISYEILISSPIKETKDLLFQTLMQSYYQECVKPSFQLQEDYIIMGVYRCDFP